jgi:hypothetical protein
MKMGGALGMDSENPSGWHDGRALHASMVSPASEADGEFKNFGVGQVR